MTSTLKQRTHGHSYIYDNKYMQIGNRKREQQRTYDAQSGLFGVDESHARALRMESYAADRAYKKQKELEDRAHMLESRGIDVRNTKNAGIAPEPPRNPKPGSKISPPKTARQVVANNSGNGGNNVGPRHIVASGASNNSSNAHGRGTPNYMRKLASFMTPPDIGQKGNMPDGGYASNRAYHQGGVATDSYVHMPMNMTSYVLQQHGNG